ncbi:hypothetical protein LR48_Vigan05g037000 [Vigna angularis]|uniref:Uncharacterized protein n=1 Tax=Phaseolus angularis TaxID=3914 RepID=A0A0L9UJ90_PHAAN|nr:hypothetical protein LR48_Vigan05g037000 [Vigna angularis]
MNPSSRVSSKEASPSAHIHTDDHCKDMTDTHTDNTMENARLRRPCTQVG